MKVSSLESMSVDQLWALHNEIALVLTRKLDVEKAQLEEKLQQLNRNVGGLKGFGSPKGFASSKGFGSSKDVGGLKEERARRPYPPVLPKYRNPAQPSETWAGRGKRPRWLIGQLKSGKKLEDFRIGATTRKRRQAAQ